ncbi:protein ALP1-like [Ixodes scapularis]|uniref:protein ALP1-like n=1 Tax=Ixodes scapularis TaxID=6945 RepID=UPI001AD723C2|nr:protein ALP1-like [Ixodes scapularis]
MASKVGPDLRASVLLLCESSSSSSSSSSGSSSGESRSRLLCERKFTELFGPRNKRPKIEDYIERTVHVYWDEEFRGNFRISRRTAYKLIDEFAASPMYPAADHGGSPAKSAEEHLLSFLWYAANKACIRDVAGRFNLGESTLHGMMDRVLDFILSIGPRLIKFPEDLERLSRDFEEVFGVPGTIGCVDGSYITIERPAKKIRSTYVNRHGYPSLTLQAICDRHKRFLDVTTGHPSKVHDARVYRTSSIADKLPEICRRSQYHILGNAAYPLREYMLTPFRDYGRLTAKQRNFNLKFSGTRVLIENSFADLKKRFRQLKLLEFITVDHSAKFIIACCVPHNLCIEAGEHSVVEDPEDGEARRPDTDSLEEFGPMTATDSILRRLGVEKRDRVIAQMGLR